MSDNKVIVFIIGIVMIGIVGYKQVEAKENIEMAKLGYIQQPIDENTNRLMWVKKQ